MNKDASEFLLRGFRAADATPLVTNLQFADDTLIFCDASEEQIRNLKAILICFEAVSGLKINFFRSELIGVRVGEAFLYKYADLFGCKVGSFPASYLELPLCLGSAKKDV